MTLILKHGQFVAYERRCSCIPLEQRQITVDLNNARNAAIMNFIDRYSKN